ncbi:cell division protein FtsX [Magnetococcus marinus MC-1]|uniref:Cell division protein FtsX n=1 Tax=Magnetococcus marinus (strain ATCC BAA-1437 / JCM 17883 / MC-1) TaxID=156889 RepID=A0LDP9_MAGMM|nr:permease-like cell division protein FtsX [Magnetococcus marinus]ABK46092.1 cell division protein FtsX [Magnetococcus marinus MC-1]
MNRPTRSVSRSRPQRRMRKTAPMTPTIPQPTKPPKLSGGFHHRAIRQAIGQFRSGSMAHWTTIVVIALSLTIYGAFALLVTNANMVLEQWRGDNMIALFLSVHANQNQMDNVYQQLAQYPGVIELNAVSPSTALTRMKALLGTEAGLLNGLDENPLPYSLEFKLAPGHEHKTKELAQQATGWDGVDAVTYNRQWVERLDLVVRSVRMGGNVLSFLLLTAVAFIISNTLKLTIVARKDEIEVMRFIGATDGFIKAPFVYEGIIQGILGAVGALLLLVLFHQLAAHAIHDLGSSFGFTLILVPLPLSQSALILAIGIMLGLIGAILSTMRFLSER